MLGMPRGDAKKRYREARVLAMLPFVLIMFSVTVMKVVEGFADSPERGWRLVSVVILLAIGLWLLASVLDMSLMLRNRRLVRRAVPGSSVHVVSIGIDTWNADVKSVRATVIHPNYLPLIHLAIEPDAVTLRSGFQRNTDPMVSLAYNELESLEVVRVRSTVSSGPGLRLTTGEGRLELQLLRLSPVGLGRVRRTTAEDVAAAIEARMRSGQVEAL